MSIIIKKKFDNYDYEGIRASQGRNQIHEYPAMLHSLLVSDLLDEFTEEGQNLYDPFVGSGTTVIEGLQKKLNCFGTDINPLSLLISKVRSTDVSDISKCEIDFLLESINDYSIDIPDLKNKEYWYKDYVINELGKIRSLILTISNQKIKDIFTIGLSLTARQSSNTRLHEFKRYRKNILSLNNHNPSPIQSFKKNIFFIYDILLLNPLNKYNVSLLWHDTRNKIPFNDIDIVITSPPYGDSKTTVAYGEFSSFGLEWINDLNPFGNSCIDIDRVSLGGIVNKYKLSFSNSLELIFDTISKKNSKRADQVASFFFDLYNSILNIDKVLKYNGLICFVVGNRTVMDTYINMDEILIESFENLGYNYIETRIRKISNKRMPKNNSPTNKKGILSKTMDHEFIVLMRKNDVK